MVNTNAPKVSVIVPVYNGERFLAECLESILSQNFEDMEILIADNCSTDRTSEIIQEYATRDNRIRWWRNPANLGLAGNFNLCWREARGEYVKCVCSDDKLLDPSTLRQMAESFEQNHSVTLVATASLVIDSASKVLCSRNPFPQSRSWDGKQVIVECLEQNKNLICGSATMFRKTRANRDFDGRFMQTFDFEMGCHLLEKGRFTYIAKPLCAWREHSGQQTEINHRTNSCADEHLMLIEEYSSHTWFYEVATPKMLFTQIYYLRKNYGRRANALVAMMMSKLGRASYVAFWLKHKFSGPFSRVSKKISAVLASER